MVSVCSTTNDANQLNIDTLVNMGTGCPICRADIQMVMRVYN